MGKMIVGGKPGGGGEKKPSAIGLGVIGIQGDVNGEPAEFTDAEARFDLPVDTVLAGKTVRFFACEPASVNEFICDQERSNSYVMAASVACLTGGAEIKPGEEFQFVSDNGSVKAWAKFNGQHSTPVKSVSGFRTTCGFEVDLWEVTFKCKGWRSARPAAKMSLYVRVEVYD